MQTLPIQKQVRCIIAGILLPLLLLMPGIARGETHDFKETLMNLKVRFEKLNDYRCVFESYTSDGKRTEKVRYNYFFKRPKLIRMEVLNGENEGTVLMYQDNEVRVKPGRGFLSLFSFTYQPDNKKLRDLRNHGINHSDWGWFINEHIEDYIVMNGNQVGEEAVDGRNTLVFEIISEDPPTTHYIKRERIWIDKEEFIIVKYMQYDIYGMLLQSTMYRDIVLDSCLNDELFEDFKRD